MSLKSYLPFEHVCWYVMRQPAYNLARLVSRYVHLLQNLALPETKLDKRMRVLALTQIKNSVDRLWHVKVARV